MGLTVVNERVPLDQWSVTADPDEPDSVHEQCRILTDQVRAGHRGRPSVAVLNKMLETAREQERRERGEPTEAMRRKLHAQAKDLLLERQDRIDLAEMLLQRDVDSWSSLSFDEAKRVLDAMEGYLLIRHLRIRT